MKLKYLFTLLICIIFSSCTNVTITPNPITTKHPITTDLPHNIESQTIIYSPTNTLIPTEMKQTTQPINYNCPILNSDIKIPDFKKREDVKKGLLDYLNQGGTLDILQVEMDKIGIQIIISDFTNDGINDLSISSKYPIFQNGSNAYIFSCRNNQYISLLTIDNYGPMPILLSYQDINVDGIPELTYEIIGLGAHNYSGDYLIYEWDGNKFINLISTEEVKSPKVDSGSSDQTVWMVNSISSVKDIDNNGTIELILHGGNEGGLTSCYNGPVRDETDIWTWKDTNFKLSTMTLDSPIYQYQVVFDGDDALLAGNYLTAEKLYWQSINDNSLLGIEKYFNDRNMVCYTGINYQPAEKNNLSSYALFKLLLLNIFNKNSQAETIYKSIQHEYPLNHFGHQYAELAEIAWKDSINGKDLDNVCKVITEYIDSHQEDILLPLGGKGPNYFYGESKQNKYHTSKEVCPF